MSRALHSDALGESHDGFIGVELATVHEECRRACYTRIKSRGFEGLNCIQRALSIVDGLELLKIQPKFGRKLKKAELLQSPCLASRRERRGISRMLPWSAAAMLARAAAMLSGWSPSGKAQR